MRTNKINISIKNSNREGSCGINTGNITIWVHNLHNPDDDFERFISHFIAVEFHEIGHRYDNISHCSDWYCVVCDMVWKYMNNGKKQWYKTYSKQIDAIAKHDNEQHKTWKETC